jgi:hypothetical protein
MRTASQDQRMRCVNVEYSRGIVYQVRGIRTVGWLDVCVNDEAFILRFLECPEFVAVLKCVNELEEVHPDLVFWDVFLLLELAVKQADEISALAQLSEQHHP